MEMLPEFEKHKNYSDDWYCKTVTLLEQEYNAIREALAGMELVANENASLKLTVMSQAAAVEAAEKGRDELQKKLAIAESLIDFELLTELEDRYGAIAKAGGE